MAYQGSPNWFGLVWSGSFWPVRFYEIYLKMAQNCCDRDRITWLDMHSNIKMARIFFPFVSSHFEVWISKWPQTPKWRFTNRFYLSNFLGFCQIFIKLLSWDSRCLRKGKYLGHFEVWMHIKSRGPVSVTAVLGHFEVYLVIL